MRASFRKSAPRCLMVALAACASPEPPEGLAPTPPGDGPRIVFDLTARPLPEVPFPNDVATRQDPTSPTGKRINAALTAPGALERTVRQRFDQLDGWGTFSPITVRFTAPLHLGNIVARHHNDDLRDDAVFVVNIDPRSPRFGQPTMLDMGRGNFPITAHAQDQYFMNDEHADGSNLLYETHEEDQNQNGVIDPGEDLDMDGVLDHPNTFTRGGDVWHDLVTFYEKETNTLTIRPVVPLEQQTRYAVVLTRRLIGDDFRPVRSPFPFINHAAQTQDLKPLLEVLPRLGLGLSEVAFAWSFTTQSVTRDLEAIRAGFDGEGPFAWLAEEIPASAQWDMVRDDGATDARGQVVQNLYTLTAEDAQNLFRAIGPQFGGLTGGLLAVLDSFKFIDYVVMGRYQTPYFLAQPGGVFDLDHRTGRARWEKRTVHFVLAVPKECPAELASCGEGRRRPFPVVLYGHGYTSSRLEFLGFAGIMAQHGLATVSIDAVSHGLAIPASLGPIVQGIAAQYGLSRLAHVLLQNRANDLNRDGQVDSGGDFWTADVFHTRDVVRQTVVDWMALFRVLRGLDGKRGAGVDFDGDGILDFDGDFDGDGRVDVGGPKVTYHCMGSSLGGMLGSVAPAVEPALRSCAPVSGGGGLGDIGIRTTQGGVVQAVFLEILGPLVASQLDAGGKVQLVFNALDVNEEVVLPFAEDVPAVPGDVVVMENLRSGEARRALVRPPSAGKPAPQIRVAVASDEGDPLRIRVLDASGAEKRVIDTFEARVVFQGRVWEKGTPLRALHRGFGLRRQSPELRRFLALAQTILEPGDGVNYARHYFKDPLPIRGGKGADMLIVGTAGDSNVPIHTSMNIARAAGILGYEMPDPRYGKSQNQVLIDFGAMEALEKYRLFRGPPWYDERETIGDPDWMHEGEDDRFPPTLSPPLRATVRTTTGWSALRLPFHSPRGSHGLSVPEPEKRWDMGTYLPHYIAHYFRHGRLAEDDMPWSPSCAADWKKCHLCLRWGECPTLPTR